MGPSSKLAVPSAMAGFFLAIGEMILQTAQQTFLTGLFVEDRAMQFVAVLLVVFTDWCVVDSKDTH